MDDNESQKRILNEFASKSAVDIPPRSLRQDKKCTIIAKSTAKVLNSYKSMMATYLRN